MKKYKHIILFLSYCLLCVSATPCLRAGPAGISLENSGNIFKESFTSVTKDSTKTKKPDSIQLRQLAQMRSNNGIAPVVASSTPLGS